MQLLAHRAKSVAARRKLGAVRARVAMTSFMGTGGFRCGNAAWPDGPKSALRARSKSGDPLSPP
jgi:hypothetical protein